MREYVRPIAVVDLFAANDSFAACGKTPDGIYHFKCDAARGTLYYYPNGTGSAAQKIGIYHPCGETHDTTNPGNFYEGFVDRSHGLNWPNGKEDNDEHVLVWLGDDADNGHATVSLSMGEIEVERS